MTPAVATPKEQYTGRELRFLADNYEQAQSLRVETGERIRAVVQGRDNTFIAIGDIIAPEDEGDEHLWLDGEGVSRTADQVLTAIQNGHTPGPVPMLGRSHHRYWREERETYADMIRALHSHPAWSWLDRVRGIGPTLGCKLLARFDATKAQYASSFWAYAGLSTVPAEEYRCSTCSLVCAWPVGYNVTGKHKALGSTANCKGVLEKVRGPEDGVRASQPRSARGEKATYDAYAKKVMYLVATSFLKAGGPYEEFYRRERAKAEVERPGWADGRKHYLALRKTQKLFLSHLWQVWREAIGLPTPDTWAMAHGGHDSKIEPSEMV